MSQEPRDLFKWHSCQQVLHGERIPQHMEVSWLGKAVGFGKQLRMSLCSLFHNLPEDLDPIRDFTLALAAAAPEEITGMRMAGSWHSSQLLGHFIRQQPIHRRACFAFHLPLIKEDRIIVSQLVLG